MSESKCAHCGATGHRLTRWCQKCGKSMGNPEIPIKYAPLPVPSTSPNPVIDIFPKAEPSTNGFNFVPQPAGVPAPVAAPAVSAFNFLPQPATGERPTPAASYNVTAPPASQPAAQAGVFNFLPQPAAAKPSYQAPEYAAVDNQGYDNTLDSSGVWRDKNMMVVIQGAVLPNRCVKCNGHAETERITRKLSWHHPALYIVLLFSWPIYVIVRLIIRKKAVMDIPLCTQHKTTRKLIMAVGGIIILTGLVVLFGAFSTRSIESLSFSHLLLLVGIAVLRRSSRVVVPKKIDNEYVWVKGVSKELLQQLPSV